MSGQPLFEVIHHEDDTLPIIEKIANQDSYDDSTPGFSIDAFPIKSFTRWREFYEDAIELWQLLISKLKYRFLYFGGIAVLLTLVIFGQGGTTVKLNGVSPSGWYSFYAIVVATHTFSTIIDDIFFWLLNSVWSGPAEFILYASCLNGPLSVIVTLSIINSNFYDMAVPQATDYWGSLMSTLITVWLFFVVRRLSQRQGLNKQLAARYSDKLIDMEMDAYILTLLASYLPNTPVTGTRPASHVPSPTSPSPCPPSQDSASHSGTQHAIEVLGAAGLVATLRKMAQRRAEERQALHSIFSEITEPSPPGQPPQETAGGSRARGAMRSYGSAISAVPVGTARRNMSAEDAADVCVTFWDRLHTFSKGVLRVHTPSGLLTIHRRQFVEPFSSRLYLLLSHAGHRKVTGKWLVSVLRSAIERIRNGQEGPLSSFGHRDYRKIQWFLDETDHEKIVERMLKLFSVDAQSRAGLSQDDVHKTCQDIFFRHKHIASSLSDFGDLNRSIANVLDGLFWIAMLFVAQFILKVDTIDLLAPLLTIVFGLSYAVSTTISNVCLSIGYVLFVVPYDVGDRVVIGHGPARVVGNVVGITLLHTTIKTSYNERVSGVYVNECIFCVWRAA